MLDSDVRPSSRSTDDPLVTGKNKKDRHMLPTSPSINAILSNFTSHLAKVVNLTSDKKKKRFSLHTNY